MTSARNTLPYIVYGEFSWIEMEYGTIDLGDAVTGQGQGFVHALRSVLPWSSDIILRR